MVVAATEAGAMVDEREDLMAAEEGAPTNSPGKVVCPNNNICTKAGAEVETIIVVAVATIAKVEDRQLTITITIILMITQLGVELVKIMNRQEITTTLPMKVVHLHHRNGD